MDDRVSADDVADAVLRHITRAGDKGVSLAELERLTGLRYRVLHNVTWTLEGSPEPKTNSPNYGVPRYPERIRARRLNTGDRSVRYVAVDTSRAMFVRYILNEAGDVYAREMSDGSIEDVNPEAWGWGSPSHTVAPEHRYTLDELITLPGFGLTGVAGPTFVPGPRSTTATWMAWADGAAPPTAYESRGGAGGYFSRLTEVLGYVARSLPRNPDSSPYVVHDFVQGRRLQIDYEPPPLGPSGDGLVYVLDDGFALKFGHTTKAPAMRVSNLQTGNPRPLVVLATIAAASPATESHVHQRLEAWFVRGEWYQRDPILAAVNDAGGWGPYLESLLPTGDWQIAVLAQI